MRNRRHRGGFVIPISLANDPESSYEVFGPKDVNMVYEDRTRYSDIKKQKPNGVITGQSRRLLSGKDLVDLCRRSCLPFKAHNFVLEGEGFLEGRGSRYRGSSP